MVHLCFYSPTSNTLLDCGEGTYTQLVRFYGLEEIDDILIHLNCIYVSHLHADHHIGLIGLLKARRIAFNNRNLPFKKLLLLAPDQIADYLNKFDRIFESIKSDYILIPNQKLVSCYYYFVRISDAELHNYICATQPR